MVEIKSQNEIFCFEITSTTGNTLLKSTEFTNKQQAQEALAAIHQFRNKKIVRFERRTDHDGRFYFQMKNASGTVLGESQRYDSEPGMENGIKNLKKLLSVITNRV